MIKKEKTLNLLNFEFLASIVLFKPQSYRIKEKKFIIIKHVFSIETRIIVTFMQHLAKNKLIYYVFNEKIRV